MVVWIIGMSGSGKTAVGRRVYESLKKQHQNAVFLDGDILRDVWGDSLGHTLEARKKNADRICALCKMLDAQGIHVVAAVLSIFPESQKWNRENYEAYYEIFLDVPFEELVRRDSKGLYKRALAGELANVVGVDISFPKPNNPDMVIKNYGSVTEQGASAEIWAEIKMMFDAKGQTA